VSKPPLPDCCEDYIVLENQKLVQDKTIGAPDPLLYKAEIKITAGPQVIIEKDNTVHFEAGEMIDLLPGFTVEAGAIFDAIITPCSDITDKSMRIIDNESSDDEEESEENFEESEFLIEETNYKIYPNPNEGIFLIEFEVNPVDLYEINIIDLQGKVLRNYKKIDSKYLEVDISSYNSGVYLLNIIDIINKKTYSHKIVKQ
jgi:hypothetical protein